MSIVEQQIWDYLDGNLNGPDRKLIEKLIETDLYYRSVYEELRSLNVDLSSLELDVPSMSFNRNVMERVALEANPGSIKSLIDKRVIYGISAFFLLAILSLLLFLFLAIDWSYIPEPGYSEFKMPELNYSALLNSTVINTFLFIDVALGLLFIDGFLRKRTLLKKL